MMSAIIIRTLACAALWWVLIEGQSDYAIYALIAVPLTVVTSFWISPHRAGPGPGTNIAVRAVAMVRLIGWILWRALRGGLDVSRRAVALRRGGDVDPEEITVDVRLTGAPRAIALGIFNLMPGTLVYRDKATSADIHVLAADIGAEAAWDGLENRMMAAVGQPHRGADPDRHN